MKHFSVFVLCLVFAPLYLLSNNLQISGVSATTSTVTFNIQWDNSWNINNLSRDAVWIFVKSQDCSSTNKSWDHLNLSTSSGDHSVSGGVLKIDAVTDGKGVFIYRSDFGGGNNASASVTLTFATPFANITQVNFDVIGIEMVYVAQGSFYVGDGASTNDFGGGSGAGTNVPSLITSEAQIGANGICSFTGCCNNQQHDVIPAAFPKGFNAFYCMKYEITQAQYVHFLNSLNSNQQSSRQGQSVAAAANTYVLAPNATTAKRNAIKLVTPASGNPMSPAVYGYDGNGNNVCGEATDGGGVPCNYLLWNDLLAYLDWAALRPMTEMEFEKACRGPNAYLNGEYPWGTTANLRARADGANITNRGADNEMSSIAGDGLVNANYGPCCSSDVSNTVDAGPIRSGFAASVGTSRAQAGATYYGILDMAGQCYEQCYHIGRSQGTVTPAIFTGVLGDGTVDANGNANQTNWGSPLGVIDAQYSIIRGGSFLDDISRARTSDRNFLQTIFSTRTLSLGGRGVRQF